MQIPKMPHSNDPVSPCDEASPDEQRARQGALVWIRQALSDIDTAMESENTDAAQSLLHRVQDVLDMLAGHRTPADTERRRISEIRSLVDQAGRKKQA
jgi:hypothetical protein